MFNLEDREKVRELFARFCHGMDEGRYAEWVETFTPDGVFDSPIAGHHAGHTALRNFTDDIAASPFGKARQRHLISNLSLSLPERHGAAVCNLQVYVTRDGETSLLMVGGYHAELVKLGDDWRFSKVTPFTDTRVANQIELD